MKLEGTFTLLSPLSHIGESISTDSYLNEEPVVQPSSKVESVFVYNGNAWRGQLRDLLALDLCERLGIRLPLPAFHLLFSGGSIGDSVSVDLAQARRIRELLPAVSLLGGGVGNQMLPGRLIVGNSYPICRETAHLVPVQFHPEELQEYRLLTTEKSFTRTDDRKHAHRADHLDGERGTDTQQMRYTVELLAAGTRLYTYLLLDRVSGRELGALETALLRFAARPFIGGEASKGHGRVRLVYNLDGQPWYDSEELFAQPNIEEADTSATYSGHIASHADEIRQVLIGEIT